MADVHVDKRVQRGLRSRRAILDRAMDIASVEGLESLSVRRLATELDVSKSGVFAQFGSKEELQLATVRAAVEVFVGKVVKPARKAPAGLRRVWALAQSWLAYVRQPVFEGGCFFVATAAEFDARPGRVRDAIAAGRRDWQSLYRTTIAEAQELGEIDPDVDPAQLAFELDALTRAAAEDALLHDDPSRYDYARTAVRARLAAVATPDAPALPAD
ncbi:TetR/AcrR family transcriptional regulator [Amycolatopsis methanolica]|uniref:Regulatory protein TetR n=1 Tax=Amycolatopsis methanolica 239 TaxID=1068978 RepID=A0A076MXI4_AMYME|nr:TetR/AcrR family transcriptional regulator [Amycolatopsis methanolica]AIJ25699.1 regulatory protein TetR [Amycolatopsis methanolica 239]